MRFLFETYHISLYARMYRALLLREVDTVEYGEIAGRIAREHHTLSAATTALRLQTLHILSKPAYARSIEEHKLVGGLLKQRNALHDDLCGQWQPSQFFGLCKTATAVRCKSTKRIYEIGSRGAALYLILRGSVRLFSQVPYLAPI